MPTFVEIAVNLSQVSGVFHYHLPPALEGQVSAGHLVEVPFGKQSVQGVVLRTIDQPEVAETRAVTRLIDAEPVLTPAQIALSQQLAKETLSSRAAIIGLMLPPGLGQEADTLYALSSTKPSPDEALSTVARRLLALLEKRGALRGRQIDALLPHVAWRGAAQAFVRRGILMTQPVLPPPSVQPKQIRTVQLAVPPEQAEAAMPHLGRGEALTRRQAMLRFLLQEPEPVNVSWVYAESGGNASDLRALAERGLVTLSEAEIWRDPLEKVAFSPFAALTLTETQEAAWRQVEAGIIAAAEGKIVRPFLLHGVTGSGKTEIYLRAIEETLRRGKQAMLLVPEIAITPQIVRRVMGRFPGQVGLVHSRLSPGERYDTWRRARQGLISVVVGPRSALFSPLPRLGLIVLDECHDDSYYQAEPPFYHAHQAAQAYARLTGAVCLLGSATPAVVTRHQAERGEMSYLRLAERIQGQIPPVQVVDMRRELKAGNTHIFSKPLQAALREVLQRGQQAILFLNRRGSATFVFCRECGHTLRCPRCELPLTLHSDQSAELLNCHHCGYKRQPPAKCPECGGTKIRHFGTGTEKVEREVQALFPTARTLRWDYSTTRHKGAHEVILHHFANHQADVLIGTQMIAKGLDLPLVTLVGVVLADVGLSLPDYRAPERVFQILMQVAGRAGRSALGGQVILQTFQPDHYAIQCAARHDDAGFYEQELKYRRSLGYPPFGKLVRLELRGPDSQRIEAQAQKLAVQLKAWVAAEGRRATEIIGPAPCFFSRVGGLYRWQIILRGPDPASLLRGKTLGDWRIEVEPVSLL